MPTRTRIIAEARAWIGTPYRHQGSLRSVGCDCLGLVRGVWRALNGSEPEATPAYTPDWAEASGAESLAEAARRHLVELEDPRAFAPGDVLLFRYSNRYPAKHAAIATAPRTAGRARSPCTWSAASHAGAGAAPSIPRCSRGSSTAASASRSRE